MAKQLYNTAKRRENNENDGDIDGGNDSDGGTFMGRAISNDDGTINDSDMNVMADVNDVDDDDVKRNTAAIDGGERNDGGDVNDGGNTIVPSSPPPSSSSPPSSPAKPFSAAQERDEEAERRRLEQERKEREEREALSIAHSELLASHQKLVMNKHTNKTKSKTKDTNAIS